MFGRSRESRTREAAGRRNWPEAVPKKMRGRKRMLTEIREGRDLGADFDSEDGMDDLFSPFRLLRGILSRTKASQHRSYSVDL